MRTRVFRTHLQKPALGSATENAEVDRSADHVRKQRDHFDVHRACP
jgi:hypothetical protein